MKTWKKLYTYNKDTLEVLERLDENGIPPEHIKIVSDVNGGLSTSTNLEYYYYSDKTL